jgi:cobalamin biosynthetic protein CobC
LLGIARGPEHGGRLREAQRLFPDAPEPFLDLSTGINPVPYPVPPLADDAWTRLPEPEDIAGLEVAAARAYGVADARMVVAAPGTQSLIALVPRIFAQSSVTILAPTYGEYARAFAAAGSGVQEVRGLDDMSKAESVVVCNPNNPDGWRFDADELLRGVRSFRSARLIVVDESFADFDAEDTSLAPHLPQSGLIVLRSLSKTFGLPGLRLGFALTTPELAAPLRAGLGPWPVSGPAVAIGAQALADRGWLRTAKARLERDVSRLDGLLDLAGLRLVGGTLLFRLAESKQASALFRRLGEAGILVRRFSYRPDWLRFGIPGGEEAWQRLDRALS